MRALAAVLLCACATSRSGAGTPSAFWAQRMDLEVWEPPSEPIAPHRRAVFFEVTCEKGADAAACRNGGAASPDGKAFEDRLAACFELRRAKAPDLLLQEWARALAQPRLPPQFQRVSGAFALVHVRTPQWKEAVQVFPPGWKHRPVFAPAPVEVFWVHLGAASGGRFMLDRPFADAFGPELSIPPPDRALEVLAKYPTSGPATLRAALLIDTAIAQFRLRDLAAGRETTRRLRDLAAAEELDGKQLALAPTLRTLKTIAAGALSVKDPCEKR